MTKPNPHDLINLPGAGNAEKALRNAGMWRLTALELLWTIPEDECTNRTNDTLWIMESELMAMEAK